MQLLEQLFAKVAYPKSAEFLANSTLLWLGNVLLGREQWCGQLIRHPKEGLVAIDYRLIQSNGSWRVRDIILDDVSLATERTQFNKIITEHSYAELLRRMREKLTE